MSHPQPSQEQTMPAETDKYRRTAHNVALLGLVACPALMLLPPRKLDFYTFGLVGGTTFFGNYLYKERYGQSLMQRFSGASPAQIPMLRAQGQLGTSQPYSTMQKQSPETLSVNTLKTGDERSWVAERQEEEKEAAEEGKGVGGMIIDQVGDVLKHGRTN